MTEKAFDWKGEVAWCAGCGNFGIINVLKKALNELNLPPEKVVLVSGIGQAAKTPQYINANFFNGLHGRALGPATAMKAANPELNVIVTSGDGDMYGEGGNHFIHTIRRNPDITVIVHDNMIYGLTKGQASPTTQKGLKTPVQTMGVMLEPLNPIALAISMDASFVARASINDLEKTKEIIKKAIQHKGFSLVDIFQPCVTFNKLNTYEWFKEHTYYLESHNTSDKVAAFAKALETEKFPLGIFYVVEKQTFNEMTGVYETNKTPIIKRELDKSAIVKLLSKESQEKVQPSLAINTSKPSAASLKPGMYPARIEYIHNETPDVKTFVLERPVGFNYKAGQFVMLQFPDARKIDGKDSIPLTLASSPTEDKIRITIKDLGGFTQEIFKLKIGDQVLVSAARGNTFVFDETHPEKLVLLSAGTGITPFISILRFIKDKKLSNQVVMLNGNCNYSDIIYREELDYLGHTLKNVYVMNTLTRYDADWGGEHGYVTSQMVSKYVSNPADWTFMICGPPAMTKTLQEDLARLGVPPEKIKFDKWEIPAKCDLKKQN